MLRANQGFDVQGELEKMSNRVNNMTKPHAQDDGASPSSSQPEAQVVVAPK